MTAAACVIDSDAVPADDDGIRQTLGAPTGFETALEQAVLACGSGSALRRATSDFDEVLFVLEGACVLRADGEEHALEPGSGAYLAPGLEYELENTGTAWLRVVAVRIPDPGRGLQDAGDPEPDARVAISRLTDQDTEAATTDREFRIVADPGCGLRSATHFVGYIPTKRAPDHFHTYDEVIYVLDGEGVLEIGGRQAPIRTGTCIHLPRTLVHCLANTGESDMRVLGVFTPAGSPAEAYYPDGTLAVVPERS